jgi:hypothetical protein
MKRFLGILSCVIAFAACDDGDLIVDTINFDEVATSTCPANNLLFKLKESESLILNVPKTTFKEDATVKPINLQIDATNEVVYNFYDGKVVADKICDLTPPPSPNIKTQWKASDGIIEITTVTVKSSEDTNNSTKITGYKNTIVFRNITFAKEDGTTQFYETFSFGDYLQPITQLKLDFKQVLNICDKTNETTRFVYNYNPSESLSLDIDKDLIKNEATPVGNPRTGVVGLVKNKLVYRLYDNGVLQQSYFCQAKDPLLPTVKEEWLGIEGGTIEVTTTTVGNDFKHTIVLKNVSLKKGNSNFRLGDIYKYGAFTVTP